MDKWNSVVNPHYWAGKGRKSPGEPLYTTAEVCERLGCKRSVLDGVEPWTTNHVGGKTRKMWRLSDVKAFLRKN